MMKRWVSGMMLGAILLGGVVLAQGGAQLPPATDEIAAMEHAFSQVTEFFATLISELKGAVSTLNAADQDLLAKYRAVAVQLKDAEARILQLQDVCARVPALAKGVEGLSARLEEAWARIGELRADVEAGKRTDQELAASIALLADNMEKTKDQLTAAIAELGNKMSEIARQVDNHETRIAALEAQDIGSLQRRVLALEQAAQALQIKIENNREKVAGLEKVLGGFTADLEATKTALGALAAKVDEHEARLATVETTVDGLNVKAVQEALGMAQGVATIALLAGIAALVLYLVGMGSGG